MAIENGRGVRLGAGRERHLQLYWAGHDPPLPGTNPSASIALLLAATCYCSLLGEDLVDEAHGDRSIADG
jgi:hypothetical protein